MSENFYRFDLQPLPYDYSALEPHINTETMQVHHNRLLKAYVDRLNAILSGYPALQKMSLERMLRNTRALPASARIPVVNFGGGVYNHNFFFQSLRPGMEGNMPMGALDRAIQRSFGSCDEFKKEMKAKAMEVFGSGWTWLCMDGRGGLVIQQTANQDCPLSRGYTPLITVDMWEHAYFLQYLNLRSEYIDNWFFVINWDRANEIYGGR